MFEGDCEKQNENDTPQFVDSVDCTFDSLLKDPRHQIHHINQLKRFVILLQKVNNRFHFIKSDIFSHKIFDEFNQNVAKFSNLTIGEIVLKE
jgi:hypothetical protein